MSSFRDVWRSRVEALMRRPRVFGGKMMAVEGVVEGLVEGSF